MVEQGDILKVEGIDHEVLVVSKDLFNTSGRIIVCPISREQSGATLSVPIDEHRCVLCDNVRQLDAEARRYSIKGRVPLAIMIRVIDRIQSVFDYC